MARTAGLAASLIQPTRNFVPNGNFEGDTLNSFAPTGWTVNTPATHSQQISNDFACPSIVSSQCLKIFPATNQANYMYMDLPYAINQNFILSFYIKCTSWTAGSLLVDIKSTNFTTTIFANAQAQSVFDWTRISYTCKTNQIGRARLIFDWNSASNNFVYYIDGIQFERQVAITPYCDGGQGTGYNWDGTANNSSSYRLSRISA